MQSHRATFSLLGALWMLLWAVSFNTSMSLTKLLSGDISTFMIVFVRLCFGLAFISPILLKEGPALLKTTRFPLHLLRVVFTCTSMVCTYYAYTHLPLAFATSIGFTAPIMTSLLSMFILGDRLRWIQWALIILGYGGVIIMAHPTSGGWHPAVFMALAANFFASCAMISVKKLTRTETTGQIVLYFNLLGCALLGIISVFFWTPPSFEDLWVLGLIGATATFSQICIARAMANGDPSVLSAFEYSRLVIAIPVGMVFFEEIPTLWSILGSLIIVMTNLSMTLYETTRKKLPQQP